MSVSATQLGATEAQAAEQRQVRKRGLIGYLLLLPGALWLILFFVVPAVTLLSTSLYDPNGSILTGYSMTFHWQNYVDALSEYATPFGRSILYALLATAACVLLGYPLAYAIAFKSGRWKNLMLVAVIAPFFTSFLLRTIAWQTLLADSGPVLRIVRAEAPARSGGGPK